MIMKILIIVCVAAMEMVCAETSVSDGSKDHNKEAHKALCDLLKAAVGKWGTNGEGLSDSLKKALGKTIFGKDDGGDLTALKRGLPGDYMDWESNSGEDRGMWCGQAYYEYSLSNKKQPHWSGQSAPHNMICLCTVGAGGWPLNGSSPTGTTLCGRDKTALKSDGDKGWGGSGKEGKDQLEATWTNVTVPCLKGENGKDLKEALNEFLRRLQHKPDVNANQNRYILGENNVTETDYNACTGSPKYGICAAFFNGTTTLYPMPWWVDLQNALPEEEKFQQQKKHEEEERRKQQEEEQKADSAQTAALKSGHPTTNQTEAPNKDNLTDKLRKLNMTSGTPISMPSSWLLRAVFLI
ncbi:Variant surface glycoprotein [Trypanosoma congolense IL3000]|uniref:Variant surface glycoprotein n=1 Tax=Trypanosoma congolense (strain IL3000) TaxID=1068625 RepID=F9WB88_TRYCI|nr:Variant surface glycoprotein [Trypanosoma congolense IL3000]